jgi:hypothetical protein
LIVVRTIAHGRAKLFDLWVKHTLSLGVDVVAAVSCDDTEQVCRDYGIVYSRMNNQPLSSKINESTKLASSLYPYGIITCGSDDFISPSYLDFINKHKYNYNLIHSTDIYYYDTLSKQFAYSCGYINERKGEALAVGRFIRFDLMDLMGWRMINVDAFGSLDRYIKLKLSEYDTHIKELKFSQKETGTFVLDVKSCDNITKFKWRENYSKADESRFNELSLINEIKKYDYYNR